MNSSILSQAKLNSVQLEAATAYEGPQLLLAGAGSGKTRVLTYKIASLIQDQQVYPNRILAVTFTNKAAQEMQRRIGQILGNTQPMTWMGTFHSLCAKILRIHGSAIGYDSNFTIYDTEDQKKTLKRVLKAQGEGDGGIEPNSLKYVISQYKNKNILPTQARADADGPDEERYSFLYQCYQKELESNNAMDFDDLICQTNRLLREHEDVREKLRSTFQYILIDEFQDTNRAQFELVQHWLGAHQNITAVGDEDQSIYGWRGADISNILSFQKKFPGSKVIKMEQNYRSSGNILKAASSVIDNNTERLGKKIWTENPMGDLISLKSFENENEEALSVVQAMEASEYSPRDTAIFYRTNAQSRVLEDQLRRKKIPYVILGGIRFYDRKEVKDILAYLQVLSNPKDSMSLGRVINVPKRGIGQKSIETLVDVALEQNIPLYHALERLEEWDLSPAVRKKMQPVGVLFKRWNEKKELLPLPDLIEMVLEESGYRTMLEDSDTSESLDRLSNIEELTSAAEDFLERQPEGGLDGFLQEISLFTQGDNGKGQGEAVTLMTIHSAKGLEFPQVFLTGLEEGLFPMSRDGEDQLEEERRLFYVAVTRAEQSLHLSYAESRRVWGQTTYQAPSRFIHEVDPSCLKQEPKKAKARMFPNRSNGKYYDPVDQDLPDYDTQVDYEDVDQSLAFYPGQQVYHSKFGEGTLINTEGYGEQAKATVRFGSEVKKLVLKYAKLSVLD